MDKEAIKNYAIGALTIALLISLGFNIQPGDTHICRSLMISKHCDHLSATGTTCYPDATVKTGSKYCAEGWEKILTPAIKLKTGECSYTGSGVAFCCGVGGCTQIK